MPLSNIWNGTPVATAYRSWVNARTTGGQNEYDEATALKNMAVEVRAANRSWEEFARGDLGLHGFDYTRANALIDGVSMIGRRDIWSKIQFRGVRRLVRCELTENLPEFAIVASVIGQYRFVNAAEFDEIMKTHAPLTTDAWRQRRDKRRIENNSYRPSLEKLIRSVQVFLTRSPEHEGAFRSVRNLIYPLPPSMNLSVGVVTNANKKSGKKKVAKKRATRKGAA